ncbi:hypothetical protein SAMN05428985_11042 [Nocardioides sp. YR527]|uniref:hypothetical protein n=1 Tax=Nocardioides sp. YR527 TaxID=1881028 RepID=UPI0008877BEE|nr:hypothetical protein [Nocardioides sp. YR527]SDL14544.1 hypothetical protein SAMN05428985_11042 [Nocardioides sp. YR527]
MSLEHTTNNPADLLSDDARAWLAGTMAKNAARFGGWSMDASGDTGDGDTGSDDGTDDGDDTSSDDDSQGSDNDEGDDTEGDDDESGKDKRVTKANKEAQRYREKLRAAEKAAADNQSVLDALKKALNGDKDDAPADPKALAAEIEKQKADAAELRVSLAVHNLAAGAGANASALLDSKSFTSSISGLDPETDAKKITAAIKTAVANNPAYRLTQGSSAGGGDIDGDKSEKPAKGTKSLEQAIRDRYKK